MEERAETSFFHRRTSHEENVLLGAVIGWMLDLLEGRWKNDLWKPKG